MIDDQRAAQWAKDAGLALTQRYGKDEATAHLAIIVLALLADRAERESYCSRISPIANELELVACD
jgi:hypothetical protein